MLKRDNHYRRSLIFLFPSIILITGFLFYNLLYKGNNLVFFAISIVVMLVTLLLIAVKNGQLISIERYRNITGKDPAEFTNIYNEVEIIKQKWFIETTQKGRAELLDYSQEMLRSWKTYKENLEKSSYDATSLKLIKNFLFPADLSRLSTLLAALLAVSATIIITLGADRNSYDFLLENYKVTALLIFLYSMLIAEAIILILILIPIISPFWNAFITAIKPNNPTERNIYRYFTDMALAAHPIEKKTRGKSDFIQKLADAGYTDASPILRSLFSKFYSLPFFYQLAMIEAAYISTYNLYA